MTLNFKKLQKATHDDNLRAWTPAASLTIIQLVVLSKSLLGPYCSSRLKSEKHIPEKVPEIGNSTFDCLYWYRFLSYHKISSYQFKRQYLSQCSRSDCGSSSGYCNNSIHLYYYDYKFLITDLNWGLSSISIFSIILIYSCCILFSTDHKTISSLLFIVIIEPHWETDHPVLKKNFQSIKHIYKIKLFVRDKNRTTIWSINFTFAYMSKRIESSLKKIFACLCL